ncbi:MAG: hypothetical protein A4E49_02238 [Methanosaeta sp. PtaU1.Bin112]|nr:MAG: hypothetical protein A4E49_02238 [Methanosaeta sp. PtaU1.Bin112]
MLFSYLAISQVFFLLIFIFVAIILLILFAPFCLTLNIGKKENLVWGSIKLTWLFLTIIKREGSPQSIEELLTNIDREKDGMGGREGTDENGGDEGQDTDERKAGAKENAFIGLIRRMRKKGWGREEKKPAGKQLVEREAENLINSGENAVDGNADGKMAEKNEAERKARRYPSVRSLIDAAPALAELLGDLGRSILIKKLSCRLCFGLDDPAQTAIFSGYIWFFASLLGVSLANLALEPWFDGLRLEGTLDAEIRARLFSPIWAAIRSLRRKQIRQLVREMLGWR